VLKQVGTALKRQPSIANHSSSGHNKLVQYAAKLQAASRNPSIIDAAVAGIYGLWKDATLVYVGMSGSTDLNCAYRIVRHRRKKDKPFDSYAVLDLKDKSRHEIQLIEQSLIRKFHPCYNKHYCGRGMSKSTLIP
jgi:hypothetical protein